VDPAADDWGVLHHAIFYQGDDRDELRAIETIDGPKMLTLDTKKAKQVQGRKPASALQGYFRFFLPANVDLASLGLAVVFDNGIPGHYTVIRSGDDVAKCKLWQLSADQPMYTRKEMPADPVAMEWVRLDNNGSYIRFYPWLAREFQLLDFEFRGAAQPDVDEIDDLDRKGQVVLAAAQKVYEIAVAQDDWATLALLDSLEQWHFQLQFLASDAVQVSLHGIVEEGDLCCWRSRHLTVSLNVARNWNVFSSRWTRRRLRPWRTSWRAACSCLSREATGSASLSRLNAGASASSCRARSQTTCFKLCRPQG
jgi:hypothetical protein